MLPVALPAPAVPTVAHAGASDPRKHLRATALVIRPTNSGRIKK